MTFLCMVLLTMLAAGCIGGLINFFLADSPTDKDLNFAKHMFVSTGATILVPLFLNITSSNMLSEMKLDLTDQQNAIRFLSFAGLCLLAALSPRPFLQSMSKYLVRQVDEAGKKADAANAKSDDAKKKSEEAKAKSDDANAKSDAAKTKSEKAEKTAERVEEAVESSMEPEFEAGATGNEAVLATISSTDPRMAVLRAMLYSPYTMRTASGLAAELKLTRQEVQDRLDKMVDDGLLVRRTNRAGSPLWQPTQKGAVLFRQST